MKKYGCIIISIIVALQICAYNVHAGEITLSIQGCSAVIGETIEIPVVLSEGSGIQALDFELMYNSDVLTVKDVGITDEMNGTYNANLNSRIAFSFISSVKVDSEITVAVVRFTVNSTAKSETALSLDIDTASTRDEDLTTIVNLDIKAQGSVVTITNPIKEPEISNKPSTPSSGGGGSPVTKPAATKVPDITSEFGTGDETAASPTMFFDDTGGHWAEEYIGKLIDLKVINGYNEKNKVLFKPEQEITRAEFAKIACLAFEIDTIDENVFADSVDWADGYINGLANLGIVTGYDGCFYPNDYITRAEIVTILGRILKSGGDITADFADDGQIPDWARDNVYKLAAKNIINGYEDNTFRPYRYATRAEVAKIIILSIQ